MTARPRGPRQRVAPGIYKDAIGYAAVVVVGSGPNRQQQEHRFPAGTAMRAMTDWQTDTRATMKKSAKRQRIRGTTRGTLTADVATYVARATHLASLRTVKIMLRHWTDRLGTLPRARITHAHVEEARQAWLDGGTSAKTCNYRVGALARLYRVLDGSKAPTPCDDLAPLRTTTPPPQQVDPAMITTVMDALAAREGHDGRFTGAKTRARFMVLATSGRRPSEIMRAQRSDIDLEQRIWRVRDGKGGYTPGGLYLYPDLLAAWTAFIDADAWGAYSTSSFATTLRGAGWPDGVRPYALRSSVAMTLVERGTDLADVSAWLGHTSLQLTRKHYAPVTIGRMRRSGDTLDGRLGWGDRLAPPVGTRKKPA